MSTAGEREGLLAEYRQEERQQEDTNGRNKMANRINKHTFDPRYFTQYFTKHLALACGLVAISTFNYAFDQQGFNSTQAMPYFNMTFGYYNKDVTPPVWMLHPYYLSLLNSLVYVGFAVGAYIGSVISARYGRRMTIFCMSLWAIVTALLLVTSGVSLNRWHLLTARVLNYIYIGMELSTVPVYQSEVVPAPIRGFMVGSYQVSLGIGGLLINGICKRTSTIPSNASWMIPYGLYFIIPTFVASCIWFIPESPRWLLMKDRHEEALVALKKFRGEGNEMSAEAELDLIRASLAEEADQGTYADLFKGHNRRRTLVTMMVAFFFQATGQVFSGHYGAVFVKSLGGINPWTITVSQSGINTFTSFCGILMIDRVGRRPLYLVGSFIMGIALMVMGGLGVPQPTTHSLASGIVATMLIFQFVYVATLGPLYYTLIAELPASRLRDKSVRVGAITNIVTIFVVAFTLPYLLETPGAGLESKVGFIYGSMCFLAFVCGYLFVPELKGRSLEEVEVMFLNKDLPLRKFGQYQTDEDGIGAAISKLERLDRDDPDVAKLAARVEQHDVAKDNTRQGS